MNSSVDAAIDNFDQNEDTLDGKSSTHSMAIVLYQRSSVSGVNVCASGGGGGIPRLSAKSLEASDYDEVKIQRYPKPHRKTEPARVPSVSMLEVQKSESYSSSLLRDLIWELTKNVKHRSSSIPAWSGFNSMVSDASVPVATIRYLPFIHAPPSDFSTIFTTLIKLVSVAEHLGQKRILVTADFSI